MLRYAGKRARYPLNKLLVAIVAVVVLLGGLVTAGALWQAPGDAPSDFDLPRNWSAYVEMPDGTLIAVDVWLPAEGTTSEPVPTVIEATRYWRAPGLTAFGRTAAMFGMPLPGIHPDATTRFFNDRGYARVIVDVRGTGASYGTHEIEYAPQEVQDLATVLDWIVAQPWSSGQVVSTGVSYAGTLAELMTANQHPALVAAAPLYSDFDVQMHLSNPGGIAQPAFISVWSEMVAAMDRNDLCGVMAAGAEQPPTFLACLSSRFFVSGVKPVAGRWSDLADAVESRGNPNVLELVQGSTYRDSAAPSGLTLGATQPYEHREAIEAANVPLYVVAGWSDAATANGALARFASFDNPQSVWIGPFDHGGSNDTDPFKAPDAQPIWSAEEQLERVEAFFRQHLEGRPIRGKRLAYYVLGSGGFRTTNTWPPEGLEETFFYLDADGALAEQMPRRTAYDEFAVDFSTGTAPTSRWITQMGGGDVRYDDRSDEGIVWTSQPLAEDMALIGTPVLDFWMTSTREDGAVHSYLEVVTADGEARYLTEGVLRLLHRAPANSPFYPEFGPGHTFLEKHAEPMPTGRIVRITTSLFAIAAKIPKGARLRLRLTGADSTSFVRVPEAGEPPRWHIYRGPTKPSSISVPMSLWRDDETTIPSTHLDLVPADGP